MIHKAHFIFSVVTGPGFTSIPFNPEDIDAVFIYNRAVIGTNQLARLQRLGGKQAFAVDSGGCDVDQLVQCFVFEWLRSGSRVRVLSSYRMVAGNATV